MQEDKEQLERQKNMIYIIRVYTSISYATVLQTESKKRWEEEINKYIQQYHPTFEKEIHEYDNQTECLLFNFNNTIEISIDKLKLWYELLGLNGLNSKEEVKKLIKKELEDNGNV